MSPSFTIHLMRWEEARELAAPLRRAVFVQEQGVPEALEWDEHDDVSAHALALLGNRLAIGTGRLLPQDVSGTARIGRMAVAHEWRRRGVGTLLLQALLRAAKSQGVKEVSLHAQLTAVRFYQGFDFIPFGPPFEEAGIAHLEMRVLLRSATASR